MLQEIFEVRANLNLPTSAVQLRRILHSVKASTVKILYDHHNIACGYILWANVNKETARVVTRKGSFPHYSYEWDEGRIMLLLEIIVMPDAFAAKYGQVREFLRQQRAVLFGRKSRVTLYVRRARQVFKKRYVFPAPAAQEGAAS